jgi:hypothetical protein
MQINGLEARLSCQMAVPWVTRQANIIASAMKVGGQDIRADHV